MAIRSSLFSIFHVSFDGQSIFTTELTQAALTSLFLTGIVSGTLYLSQGASIRLLEYSLMACLRVDSSLLIISSDELLSSRILFAFSMTTSKFLRASSGYCPPKVPTRVVSIRLLAFLNSFSNNSLLEVLTIVSPLTSVAKVVIDPIDNNDPVIIIASDNPNIDLKCFFLIINFPS